MTAPPTMPRQQYIALVAAERHYERWTPGDLAVLARTDLTNAEKAAILGRSFYAVQKRAQRRPR